MNITMKNIKVVFASPDSKQTLTITASQGKKGINVKASIKTGKGKGTAKAQTGAREVVKTEQEAQAAVDTLAAHAKKSGWVKKAITSKNAFTMIPAPSGVSSKK